MYIAIDSGTTNTRVALTDGKNIIQKIKINVGARDAAVTGSTDRLKNELKKAIDTLLSENKISTENIEKITASGMIVSDSGLCPIAHVTAPVSAEMLKNSSKTVVIPEVTSIPITFIPGVKNNCSYSEVSELSDMDVMRGEETEAFGIIAMGEAKAPFIAVLPGSHTKTVTVNEKGEIISCRTSMGGEMIKAVSENTILKDAFPNGLPKEFSEEYLFFGYDFAEKYGINEALFKVRLLKMFLNVSEIELYSFFAGVILESDIKMIKKDINSCTSVAVGGSNPLKAMFYALIKKYIGGNVTPLSDETVEKCTFTGGIYITEGKLF